MASRDIEKDEVLSIEASELHLFMKDRMDLNFNF